MPFSMVLHIRLMEDCTDKEFHGAIAYNALKDVLKQYAQGCSPEQAEKIIKTYTYSPLFVGERSHRPLSEERAIRPKSLCWLRISALEEEISTNIYNSLYHNVVTNQIPALQTDVGELHVERALSNPSSGHPWVTNISQEELYNQASSEENEVLFDFVSPTLFVHRGMLTPLPIPHNIYSQLGKLWNQSAPKYQIPEETLETLGKHVTIIAFKDLATGVQPVGGGKNRVGFIGKVRVRIVGTKDAELIKYFNLLSNVAFYVGLGQAIQSGCGMTRRIPRGKWDILRDFLR